MATGTTTKAQPQTARQQPGESTKAATAAPVTAAVPGTGAGMPPTAQTLYAVVNLDGSLARGFGVVSSTGFGGGNYEVIFSQDVTGSAYVGTIGDAGSVGVPPTGQIVVVGRFGNANGVFVETSDSSGNPTDSGFHLAVHS